MAALAYPTPGPMQPRQDAYTTLSSALVLTGSVNSAASELPLDSDSAGPINTDPDAVQSVPYTFDGVGGTIALNSFTSTSTVMLPTTTLADLPAESSSATSTPNKGIPIGAVIAAFAAVAALCLLLVGVLWWRRRKRRQVAADKERWKMHRQTEKSFIAGRPETGITEGPWEEFKDRSVSSHGVHTPGVLPSPPSTGKRYVDTGRDQLLVKQPSTKGSAGPRSPRRFSMKSTVTGKVNPSNNFASEGHEEILEDDYEFDDGKSGRSRMPLTPGSGQLTFHNAGANFAGMRTLEPPPKMETPDPSSFLTFRSGEMDGETMRQNFTFPPQPSSGVRDISAAQRTPTPVRAPTQKSQKGGGASQHGHEKTPEKASESKFALDSLIAALDTPEQPRQSVMSYVSHAETLRSPAQGHVIPSPSGANPPANPFR